MGWLGRLLGGGHRSRTRLDVPITVGMRTITDTRIDVVGESHYQPAIRKACGWKRGTDTRFECMAELVPEPTNKQGPNAIMVKIDGRCVGYLSRRDAKTYGDAISEAILRQGTGMCRAMIAGRANGQTENLGVFLHLDVSTSA